MNHTKNKKTAHLKTIGAGTMIAVLMSSVQATAQTATNSLLMHYDRPAKYFEEALVIGNGTLGATIYGGTSQERISLNDITLWTGEPQNQNQTGDEHKEIAKIRELLNKEDYRKADQANRQVEGNYSQNYQPLGTLLIDYPDNAGIKTTSYLRTLDIGKAVAQTTFTVANCNEITTDYFASAPDSVIIVRIKSGNGKTINARLSFASLLPHSVTASANEITAEGYAAYQSFPGYYGALSDNDKFRYDPERGIHFRTIIHVSNDGGKVSSYPSGDIKLEGCREALILITNATSFNGFDKDPVRQGRDYRAIARQRIDRAKAIPYSQLLGNHIADYRHFFDRVDLNLGQTADSVLALPTDHQLFDYTENKRYNPTLEALYFQYGRYLLISCSRTPGVPSNLQGLWNETILPPWSSNYTTNINLEENYWAAETANLSELHLPMLQFLHNLSTTGSNTAKRYYGVGKGWCLAHNSDIWAMTNPVGLKDADPSWACWNMGGAWTATHIWEHYLFTQDKEFLKQYYPILKGAAEFCMGWLTDKDGYLITSPGTSPENKFLTPDGYAGATSYGNTSDLAMTRECISDAIAAATVLGTDRSFRKAAAKSLSRLLPYRIGKAGNLQEWYHDWSDQDPKHRHQSHLFGLYPGHHITVATTPALAKAAAKTLEIKGDETTGWSTGWRVNLYARLQDATRAYNMYRRLLRYVSPDKYEGNDARRGGGTYPNLLDAHSPFQIDGNFGGCAGVAEMLIQSSPTAITLLPTLPEQWKDGSVKGICARGGFVVDMTWNEGRVTNLTLHSRSKARTTLHYNGKSQKVSMKAGESIKVM